MSWPQEKNKKNFDLFQASGQMDVSCKIIQPLGVMSNLRVTKLLLDVDTSFRYFWNWHSYYLWEHVAILMV